MYPYLGTQQGLEGRISYPFIYMYLSIPTITS